MEGFVLSSEESGVTGLPATNHNSSRSNNEENGPEVGSTYVLANGNSQNR